MSEKRRGLGRGLGALIPTGAAPVTRPAGDRPVDVFFPGRGEAGDDAHEPVPEDAVAGVARSAAPHSAAAGAVAFLPGSRTSTSLVSPAELPTLPPLVVPADLTVPPVVAPPAGPAAPADPEEPAADEPVTNEPVTNEPATDEAGNGPDDAAEPPSPPQGRPERAPAPELVPVPGAYFAELPVGSVRPNPKQPRQVFDEESLAELVQSVREVGILQPVVVRRIDLQDGEPQYELVMGERRLRACIEAGLEQIPAIVRETQDDDLLRDALLENLHRAQLNPLEEAAAYQQLLDDFGCTHEELATRIGRSRPQISNTLRLLKLPALVQRRVAAGVLSAGHARALLGLEDPAGMERLAQRIVAEGLSVRAVEEIVALGDGPVDRPAKRRPRAGAHTSELNDLASRLGDRWDTRVAIALGRSKGKLSIEFASVDDLNRIIGLLAPDVTGAFRA